MSFLFKSKKTGKSASPSVSSSSSASSSGHFSNKDPLKWSTNDVCEWLSSLSLSQYKTAFQEGSVTGEDLLEIEEKDLDSLKVTKFADRKRLLNGVKSLKGGNKPFDSQSKSSKISTTNTSETGSTTSEDPVEELEVPLTVKCYYNDDIRSFDLEALSLENLRKRIKEEYGKEFQLKYKDDDDELVSLQSNNGLRLAARSGNILKLFLSPVQMISDAEIKLLEDMVDAVIIIDAVGVMLYVNRACTTLFGYQREQLIHKNVKILMTRKDSKQHNQYLDRYKSSGVPQVIGKGRIVDCKDSQGVEFKARLSVNETKTTGKHFFTGTIHKIENEESSIQVTQASFMFLENLLDPTIVINEKGIIMFFNKSAEGLFGFTKSETQGKNIKMLMPEPFQSDHDSYLSNYNRSGISKIINTGRDVPIQRKDGSIQTCNLKLSETDFGNKKFFTGTLSKIAEQDIKKMTLLEQERKVLKDLLIPAIIIDSKGIIQAFNAAASDSFGYSLADVIGKNISNLMFSEDGEKHDGYLRNYMETGKGNIIGIGRKIAAKKKDGSVLNAKLFVTRKSDENSTFFVGVLQLDE